MSNIFHYLIFQFGKSLRTHTMALCYDVRLYRDVDTALWYADSKWQRNAVEKCRIKNLRTWSYMTQKESGIAQLV